MTKGTKVTRKDEFIAEVQGMDAYEVRKLEEQIANGKKSRIAFNYVRLTIGILLLLILGTLIGCPQYNVYRSEMQGKAEFVQAEQNRKIKIEEAKANVEAARLDKEADSIRAIGQKNAEIIRAEGMAQAMDIENGKLTETYIKYLWVRNIEKGDKIYIPTEAGMPLLEAK